MSNSTRRIRRGNVAPKGTSRAARAAQYAAATKKLGSDLDLRALRAELAAR